MKNILIVSSSTDDRGSSLSFLKDIEDIKDPVVKDMMSNAIQKKNWESSDRKYWVYGGMCGGEMGYIFNDHLLPKLPLTIEHIIEYIIE